MLPASAASQILVQRALEPSTQLASLRAKKLPTTFYALKNAKGQYLQLTKSSHPLYLKFADSAFPLFVSLYSKEKGLVPLATPQANVQVVIHHPKVGYIGFDKQVVKTFPTIQFFCVWEMKLYEQGYFSFEHVTHKVLICDKNQLSLGTVETKWEKLFLLEPFVAPSSSFSSSPMPSSSYASALSASLAPSGSSSAPSFPTQPPPMGPPLFTPIGIPPMTATMAPSAAPYGASNGIPTPAMVVPNPAIMKYVAPTGVAPPMNGPVNPPAASNSTPMTSISPPQYLDSPIAIRTTEHRYLYRTKQNMFSFKKINIEKDPLKPVYFRFFLVSPPSPTIANPKPNALNKRSSPSPSPSTLPPCLKPFDLSAAHKSEVVIQCCDSEMYLSLQGKAMMEQSELDQDAIWTFWKHPHDPFAFTLRKKEGFLGTKQSWFNWKRSSSLVPTILVMYIAPNTGLALQRQYTAKPSFISKLSPYFSVLGALAGIGTSSVLIWSAVKSSFSSNASSAPSNTVTTVPQPSAPSAPPSKAQLSHTFPASNSEEQLGLMPGGSSTAELSVTPMPSSTFPSSSQLLQEKLGLTTSDVTMTPFPTPFHSMKSTTSELTFYPSSSNLTNESAALHFSDPTSSSIPFSDASTLNMHPNAFVPSALPNAVHPNFWPSTWAPQTDVYFTPQVGSSTVADFSFPFSSNSTTTLATTPYWTQSVGSGTIYDPSTVDSIHSFMIPNDIWNSVSEGHDLHVITSTTSSMTVSSFPPDWTHLEMTRTNPYQPDPGIGSLAM